MLKKTNQNLRPSLARLARPPVFTALLIAFLLLTALLTGACGRGDLQASPYTAEELSARALNLDERQAELDRQAVEIASRAAELAASRTALDERAAEIDDRENRLASREARIAEREAAAAASELRLNTERGRLAEERAALDKRADEIAEQAAQERAERQAREREAAKRAAAPVYTEARISAGTILDVEFLNTVSSGSSRRGEVFTTRLDHDLYSDDGLLAAPAGSEIVGTVVEAVRVRKIGGQARLGLEFDELILPSGQRVPIEASLFELGPDERGRDAQTIGGAVVGGAILGEIIDDDDGALIGALIGAAAGTAAAAHQGRDVVIPSGALVSLRLDAPVRVKVAWKSRYGER